MALKPARIITFARSVQRNFSEKFRSVCCESNVKCWRSDWHRGVRIPLLRPYCNTVWQLNVHRVNNAAACKQTCWYTRTKIFSGLFSIVHKHFEDLKVNPSTHLSTVVDYSFIFTHIQYWLKLLFFLEVCEITASIYVYTESKCE